MTVTEADATTDAHHVAYLRNVSCGAASCSNRAGRWMRCGGCQTLVARCGDHDRDLPRAAQAHCQGGSGVR